jgi:hypothetical protein
MDGKPAFMKAKTLFWIIVVNDVLVGNKSMIIAKAFSLSFREAKNRLAFFFDISQILPGERKSNLEIASPSPRLWDLSRISGMFYRPDFLLFCGY